MKASQIFHDPLVKAGLPSASAHFDAPTVVYTLKNSIGFIIFILLNLLMLMLVLQHHH